MWFSFYCETNHNALTPFLWIVAAVDCGPLSVPMNGSFSGEYTDFPNSMLFNCDPGFLLKGSPSRMCQPNGTWSGLPVICTGRSAINEGRDSYRFQSYNKV